MEDSTKNTNVSDEVWVLEHKCKGCRYYDTCMIGSMSLETRMFCKERKIAKCEEKQPAKWGEMSYNRIKHYTMQERMRIERSVDRKPD